MLIYFYLFIYNSEKYATAAEFYDDSLSLKIQKYGIKDQRVAFGNLACG